MRTISNVDFRTTAKMHQQSSACSGFPTLTPLPTYTSPALNSCYPYPVFSSHQDLPEFASAMEPNDFPVTGRLTPQTPESLIYHEPLSMGEMSDQWMPTQAWTDDPFEPMGLKFEAGMTTTFPVGLWPASDHTLAAPVSQTLWHQPSLSASPPAISHEMAPHAGAVPSLSTCEPSVVDFSGTSAFPGDWASCQPITTQLELTSMVAHAPFFPGLGANINSVPMWEDVYMHGSMPY